MTIIAVLGFPRSGKSTWLAQQYQTLRSQGKSFFVQRACPDGEGQWTFESRNGKSLRVKGRFDPEFVEWVKQSALGLNKIFDMVFLDCGGRQSEENEEILKICDRAIVIGRSLEDLQSWITWTRNVKPDIYQIEAYLSYYDETQNQVKYQKVEVVSQFPLWDG
jgi:CRISPR-associated protein Csx3